MVSCPSCERDDFKTEAGMKRHHTTIHDESLIEESRECGWCGSEIIVKQQSRKKATRVFCSDSDCESKWRSEEYSGRNSPNWRSDRGTVSPEDHDKIECRDCGRELPVDAKHFFRSGGGFECKCKECHGGSFGINDVKKHYKPEEGHRYCSKCHRELPADAEHFFRSGSGYVSRCKECSGCDFGVRDVNRGRDDGKWYCSECDTVYELSAEHFYPIPSSNTGFANICKECSNEKSVEEQQKRWSGEVALTPSEWQNVLERFDKSCAYCGETTPKLERDHVVPVSDGGASSVSNIVPACRSCNASKSTKSVSEWYVEQEFYDPDKMDKILQNRITEYD